MNSGTKNSLVGQLTCWLTHLLANSLVGQHTSMYDKGTAYLHAEVQNDKRPHQRVVIETHRALHGVLKNLVSDEVF